jgi:hypothetical protein
MHAPPAAVAALSRALGVVVRNVVLTADESRGLTAGLLVSHEPAGRSRASNGCRRTRQHSAGHTQTGWTDTSVCADDPVMPEEPFSSRR